MIKIILQHFLYDETSRFILTCNLKFQVELLEILCDTTNVLESSERLLPYSFGILLTGLRSDDGNFTRFLFRYRQDLRIERILGEISMTNYSKKTENMTGDLPRVH